MLETIRANLEAERRDVERQIEDYGATVGTSGEVKPDQGGFADSAHVAAERSEAISFLEQLMKARAEIVGALERIETGTYGRCERCGNEIPLERLEVVPTTTMCVSCKQQTAR